MKYQTVEQSFSYGHRVWGAANKCSHIHGHSAIVKLELHTPIENDQPNFCWLERFIRSNLEGKMLVDINDPFINGILDGADITTEHTYVRLSKHYGNEVLSLEPINEGINHQMMGYRINVDHWDDEPKRQFYGSFTLVNFNPTDFNCSKWIGDLALAHLCSTRWTIEQVSWHRDSLSSTTFITTETGA